MHFRASAISSLLSPVAVVMSILFLAGCGGGGDSPVLAAHTGDAVVKGAAAAELEGAWRVLGEGTLMEIKAGTLQRFQETKTMCYPQPGGPTDIDILKDYSYRTTIDLHHLRAELFEAPGFPATYSLERIDTIPSNCRAAPSPDAANSFKALGEVIDLDYAFLKERHVDWPLITARLAPQAALAADDDALQSVLVDALKEFDDVHTALIRWRDGQPTYAFLGGKKPSMQLLRRAFEAQSQVTDFLAFQAAWKSQVQQDFAPRLQNGSAGRVLGGTMVWGRLPGNVGYIEIGSMAEFSQPSNARSDLALVRAEMDRALAALADTRALVIDVSLNTLGGLDQVSAEIAGSFTRQRVLGFTKQAHRPQGRAEQSWYVEPKGNNPYLKPVYVLTSDLTVSAAETFTLMMRALPQVTLVGQATSGSLSNALVKPLPGNFYVSFSNEIYRDPHGVSYEVTGIAPRTAVTIFDPTDPATLATGHGRAIDRLLNMISPL